jgi:protein-tyrosine-phosphatase
VERKSILFIDSSDFCRCQLAESVLSFLLQLRGHLRNYFISSCVTDMDKEENRTSLPAQLLLLHHGIPSVAHETFQLACSDAYDYDFIICPAEEDMIAAGKVLDSFGRRKLSLLLSYCGRCEDIADLSLARNFQIAYTQTLEGCKALVKKLEDQWIAG